MDDVTFYLLLLHSKTCLSVGSYFWKSTVQITGLSEKLTHGTLDFEFGTVEITAPAVKYYMELYNWT